MNYIIRDDKEHETTAPKVKVIAPRKKFQPSYNDRQNRKIRVGAYCRVSTDSDEQELSYETQCEYYENYIGSHENWELIAQWSQLKKLALFLFLTHINISICICS